MAWEPKDLKVWMERMMDFLILHPRASRSEMAAAFEVTEQTITNVTKSDLFQMRLRQRQAGIAEKVDGSALNRLENKIMGLAENSVDVLSAAMEREQKLVAAGQPGLNLDGVRETCDMALQRLGFGAPKGPTHQTQVNVLVVDKETLAASRDRMRSLTSIPDGALLTAS